MDAQDAAKKKSFTNVFLGDIRFNLFHVEGLSYQENGHYYCPYEEWSEGIIKPCYICHEQTYQSKGISGLAPFSSNPINTLNFHFDQLFEAIQSIIYRAE
jgi:hypothetical protein